MSGIRCESDVQEGADSVVERVRRTRAPEIRFTLAVLAALLALLAAWFIRYGDLIWAVAPLAVAVGCFALASVGGVQIPPRARRAFESDEPEPEPSSLADSGAKTAAPWIPKLGERQLGAAAFALGGLLMYVSLRNFGHEQRESQTLAWWCFGLALALVLAAIPSLDGRWTNLTARLRTAGEIRIGLRSLLTWAALAAILALGAGLRLYNLDVLPAGLWYDEADNLSQAQQYARDPGQTPMYAPSTNLPSMFLLPIAAIVKLADVSIAAGRLVAVAFGLLGVVAVFLLARCAMGASAGVIAAFLVAVMRWDIIWSRIGMHGISGVLFAALAGWLTLRAVRSGRYSDFAFAGVSLGLGMWFYASLRMFPLVLGLLLVHHLLVDRPDIRAFAARVALMGLMAAFAAAPVAQLAADSPDRFFARTRDTSLFFIEPREQWGGSVADSVARHVMMFNRKGDPNPRHNLPDAPMLDLLTGALFVLGFFYALTQWRNPSIFWLPFWALLMLLPGILTVPWEAPQSLRSILVIPAVAALAALVIERLWRAWRDVPWVRVRRFALPVVLALLGIIAYANVSFYFGAQASDARVYAAFSTDETLMARSQIERQRLGYSLWVSRQFLFGLVSDLLADRPRYEVIGAPETLPLDSTRVWMGAAAYFEPREAGFWETMRAYYPDAQFETVTPPTGGEPLYYTGFASRELLASRQGLDAAYIENGREEASGGSAATESVWLARDGPDQYPYEVDLKGALHVPEFGEYELVLDSPRAQVDLDGQTVLWSEKPSARVALAAGLHSIAISAEIEGPDDFIRVLWRAPDGEIEPIPFGRLYRGSVRPLGLAGRFYAGDDTTGAPDSMQVTPSMDVFHYESVVPAPYSAIWDGALTVALPGNQTFRVERIGTGSVALYVDGSLVARDPPLDETTVEGEINLAPGRHEIRVEYRSESRSSQFRILWAPPGISLEPIPIEAMSPAPEYMLTVVE